MQEATPLTTNHPGEPYDPDKHPTVGEGAPKDEPPPATLPALARKLTEQSERARLEKEAFRALPRWQRIRIVTKKLWVKGWAKLGFGICAWPHPPHDKKFARDYLGTETRIRLRFYERLQLIISGRLIFRQTIQSHPKIKRSKSTVALSILPPGIE